MRESERERAREIQKFTERETQRAREKESVRAGGRARELEREREGARERTSERDGARARGGSRSSFLRSRRRPMKEKGRKGERKKPLEETGEGLCGPRTASHPQPVHCPHPTKPQISGTKSPKKNSSSGNEVVE